MFRCGRDVQISPSRTDSRRVCGQSSDPEDGKPDKEDLMVSTSTKPFFYCRLCFMFCVEETSVRTFPAWQPFSVLQQRSQSGLSHRSASLSATWQLQRRSGMLLAVNDAFPEHRIANFPAAGTDRVSAQLPATPRSGFLVGRDCSEP